jgi:eukaryotic-like serine/threonine-protein kinase
MSPEQAQGLQTLDRRTDVYSLGAILYEVLTGAPPFPGSAGLEDLVRIIRDPVRPPSEVSADGAASTWDKELERLCMKSLQKSPDSRLASAKEFADALTGRLDEAPAAGRKPRSWAPALAVLAGLAAAAAAILFRVLG